MSLIPISLKAEDLLHSFEKPQEKQEEKKYVLEEDGFENEQMGQLLEGDADADENNGIF